MKFYELIINSILLEYDHVIFNIAGMAVRSINDKNPQKQLLISTNIDVPD
jgi:hypothetical protein